MYSYDVEVRRQAIQIQHDVRTFLDGEGYADGTPAAKLDAVLRDAPSWVISSLSYRLFSPSYSWPEEREMLSQIRAELKVDPVAYAASGVGLRSFLRMKAGQIQSNVFLADLMIREIAKTEARLANESPTQRAHSRRFLQEKGKQAFDLQIALSEREREIRETQGPLSPVYGEQDRIDCPTGLTLRIPSKTEALILARQWKDGWLDLAPENAASGKVAPLSQRLQTATAMCKGGKLLGIFEGENSIGSLVVNRVSETQVELGWFTTPAHRGRGIATAAVEGLLADLHGRGILEAGARCFHTNKASMNVLTKLGFVSPPGEIALEGTMDWGNFTVQTNTFVLQNGPGI